VQTNCGSGKDFQVDNNGWVVWVGAGNSYQGRITKNLWQTYLPAGATGNPWAYKLYFGHPILDRPLAGTGRRRARAAAISLATRCLTSA